MELTDYATVEHLMSNVRLIVTLPPDEDSRRYVINTLKRWKYDIKYGFDGELELSKWRKSYIMDLLRTVYVGVWEIRDYKTATEEKCYSDECRFAEGDECICPCRGKFHGVGESSGVSDDWKKNFGKIATKGDRQVVNRWHTGWADRELTGVYWIGPDEPDEEVAE